MLNYTSIMSDVIPISNVNHRNDNIPFGIKYKERGGHIYPIDRTGMGKSTFEQNMPPFDISLGHAVGLQIQK